MIMRDYEEAASELPKGRLADSFSRIKPQVLDKVQTMPTLFNQRKMYWAIFFYFMISPDAKHSKNCLFTGEQCFLNRRLHSKQNCTSLDRSLKTCTPQGYLQ